jgi:hypothetical protein
MIGIDNLGPMDEDTIRLKAVAIEPTEA